MSERSGWPGLTIGRSVLLFAIALVVFVTLFSLAVGRRLERAAGALDTRSIAAPQLFAELADVAQVLSRTMAATYEPVPAAPAERIRAAQALRAQVRQAPNRATPGAFADIPEVMRARLARADERIASLQIALLDYAALLELGRLDAALARRADAARIEAQLQPLLSGAERAEVHDLVVRQKDLRAAALFAVRAFAWWLAGMVVATGLALVFLVRRVRRPLRDLEAGLDHVAHGDLGARIPVRSPDELGRLVEHFNRMTELLDRRAQAQGRFVAAGELISGVAHEVNNPLMAIAALSEMQLADEPSGSPHRDHYEMILRQAQRAARLLSGMLRFVRPREDEPEVADANTVVQDAVGLMSHRFASDDIQVEYALAHGLPTAKLAPSQLEQVVVNLVANAVDALHAAPPPRRIRVSTELESGMVVTSVEDNGPGVEPAIAGALFSPFATSKGTRGTGLGLFMSRNIMRAAGGELLLAPRTGRWASRFVIQAPAAAAEVQRIAPPAREVPAVPEGALEGVEVLLVDDEAPVRSPLARFLRRRGAIVREAGDGVAALALLDQAPADIVVADVRMPRMDGMALFAEIARRDPALARRVLFLSGDVAQLGALGSSEEFKGRVIVKPVDLVVLEADLVRVLECARRDGQLDRRHGERQSR